MTRTPFLLIIYSKFRSRPFQKKKKIPGNQGTCKVVTWEEGHISAKKQSGHLIQGNHFIKGLVTQRRLIKAPSNIIIFINKIFQQSE